MLSDELRCVDLYCYELLNGEMADGMQVTPDMVDQVKRALDDFPELDSVEIGLYIQMDGKETDDPSLCLDNQQRVFDTSHIIPNTEPDSLTVHVVDQM